MHSLSIHTYVHLTTHPISSPLTSPLAPSLAPFLSLQELAGDHDFYHYRGGGDKHGEINIPNTGDNTYKAPAATSSKSSGKVHVFDGDGGGSGGLSVAGGGERGRDVEMAGMNPHYQQDAAAGK